ncbi:MAG: WD40 repeat domain-containing protein, partial [Halobacteriaceae archaeon]
KTWTNRSIQGFDAPHTDDIHHLLLDEPDTLIASTGSGLYRSNNTGQTWIRLDRNHPQRYFREAFVHNDSIYAGAAMGSSSSWEEETNHGLFECHSGNNLEKVSYPTTNEVPIGWCAIDDKVVAATHRGTLIQRETEEWTPIGSVPTPGSVQGRYLPLLWHDT